MKGQEEDLALLLSVSKSKVDCSHKNAKLLPRDLDACFEDCGGVHEAEGGAVTNIKDCGCCHCKCLCY